MCDLLDEDQIRDDNEDDEDERGQEDFVEAMSSLHGKKKYASRSFLKLSSNHKKKTLKINFFFPKLE